MLAAKDLAEEHRSVQGVTISLESVAKRAGLTKPGLMYHFQTKEALMIGLVEYVAREWAAQMSDTAGRDPVGMSPFDRYRTYVTAIVTSEMSRADYWIFSAAAYQPALSESWRVEFRPWLVIEGLSVQAHSLLDAARFAADGAFTAHATGVFPSEHLDAVHALALRLIDEAEALS